MHKLKVGFIAPCVGVGGADAMMASVMNYFRTVETSWVILAQTDWLPGNITWWKEIARAPHTLYYDGMQPGEDSIVQPSEWIVDAMEKLPPVDVIISWCVNYRSPHPYESVSGTPIVEWIQNSDQMAVQIAVNNALAFKRVSVCKQTQVDTHAVIPNAADPARLQPRVPANMFREWHGITHPKIALFPCRLESEKHPELFISAAEFLPEEWGMAIAGKGAMMPTIKKMIQASPNPDRFYFFPYQYDMGDLYNLSNCVTLLSDFEGDPLTVHEAGYRMVPVVLRNSPCLGHYVQQGKNDMLALCSDPGGPKEIADAIIDSQKLIPTGKTLEHYLVVNNGFLAAQVSNTWETFLYSTVSEYSDHRRLGGKAYKIEPKLFTRPGQEK